MNGKEFLNTEKATLTVMVQADTPARIKELMDKSVPLGAEAFGIQIEQLLPEYRKNEVYRDLFAYAGERPVYATNYRDKQNVGKSDEKLAEELLEIADCGADLCDVIGDLFDKQPDELAKDSAAVEKQKELIRRLHAKGAYVLMSSHVIKYTPAERVLEIALAHKERGADICKIVTGADTMEEQLENIKMINMLKEKLGIPFLFLCVGKCGLLRRVGGEIGCCMYLCVYEYDKFAARQQPLLKNLKAIRDNMDVV